MMPKHNEYGDIVETNMQIFIFWLELIGSFTLN